MFVVSVDCKAVALHEHDTLEEAYQCAVRHLGLWAKPGEHFVQVREVSYFDRSTPEIAESQASKYGMPSLGGIIMVCSCGTPHRPIDGGRKSGLKML